MRSSLPQIFVHGCLCTLVWLCSSADVTCQVPDAPDAASTSESPSDEATIQFSFREQPWLDVLDFFARQADMSLVVQQAPAGSFTYSDTREYSPLQALDLLNGVLSARGYTLIRRGRTLVCINLADGLPANLIPRVELGELDNYGQYEIVEVMFPLGKRPPQNVEEEVQPLIGPYGVAKALNQTRQLLVTSTAGRMRGIAALIESIPEPQPPQPKPPEPKPPAPGSGNLFGQRFGSKRHR